MKVAERLVATPERIQFIQTELKTKHDQRLLHQLSLEDGDKVQIRLSYSGSQPQVSFASVRYLYPFTQSDVLRLSACHYVICSQSIKYLCILHFSRPRQHYLQCRNHPVLAAGQLPARQQALLPLLPLP